jgi:hypothetical protein
LADNIGHIFQHLSDSFYGPDFLLVFHKSKDEINDLFLKVETDISIEKQFGRLDQVQNVVQMGVHDIRGRDYVSYGF